MTNRSAMSLVTELSSVSSPSISEIVNLFSGLHEQRGINNFVRVFKTKYSDNPLMPGNNPSRFGYSSNSDRIEDKVLPIITYGARTIATAIYESIVRDSLDINPDRILLPAAYLER